MTIINRVLLSRRSFFRGHVTIQSTLDKTERLSAIESESVTFDEKDLVVIKNRDDGPTVIRFRVLESEHGVIIASNRQYTRKLHKGSDDSIKMRGGETLTLHSNDPKFGQHGHGGGLTEV